MPSSTPPKMRDLPPTPLLSKRVRIQGLPADQDEFNGAFGRTLTFKTDTGCYMVVVEGSETFLELKPEYISDASAQGVSETAVEISKSSTDVPARAGKDVQKQTEHVARMQLAPDANGNKVVAGARVEIFGLQSKAELNNTFGRVVAYKLDRGRFAVQLEVEVWDAGVCAHKLAWSAEPPILIKPDNLRLSKRKPAERSQTAECEVEEPPIPMPTAPVGEADCGDEEFECMQTYLQAALRAGDGGNLAKEIAMLERAVERDSHQPSACYYLAGAYAKRKGEGDLARAIQRMDEAATLLLDPLSQPASEPASVMTSSIQQTPGGADAKLLMVTMVVRDGAKLVNDGVRGKSGAELSSHLALAQHVTELAAQPRARIECQLVSHAFHVLGNVQRKMMDLGAAIASFRRADAALAGQGHDLVSLALVPDLLANQAVALSKQPAATSDGTAASEAEQPKGSWRALLAEAVDEARRLLELAPPESFAGRGAGDFKRCDAQILLARMLFTQLGMTPPAEQQANQARIREHARETLELAKAAQIAALRHGDGRVAALAAQLCQAVQSGQSAGQK